MAFNAFWKLGCLSAASAVMLGAYGAHGLKRRLPPGADTSEKLQMWGTAVHYHMIHSVALLFSSLRHQHTGRSTLLPSLLFSGGMAAFSGSIYMLVLMDEHQKRDWGPIVGRVTPIGGMALIAGWIAMALM
jgi:uncharacterized membrane protein YgdD (TMEM256/DUF423 family)